MSTSDGRRAASDRKRQQTPLVVAKRDRRWVVTRGGVPVEDRGETSSHHRRTASERVDA